MADDRPLTDPSRAHFRRTEYPPNLPAYLYPPGDYSLSGISLRAFLLGISLSTALHISYLLRHSYPTLPLFIAALSLFHFLEYFITARYNTPRAKIGAFILTNNGAQYHIAHGSAILESLIEHYFFPGLERHRWIMLVGLGLMVFGQCLRSMAMVQAAGNFSHYVAFRKEQEHRLVKEGVYAVWRHPSYTGYWWWAVGTQVMLGNPVCTVGFAAVLWYFFYTRIAEEEMLLCRFFPGEYEEYRRNSWIGIPFLRSKK